MERTQHLPADLGRSCIFFRLAVHGCELPWMEEFLHEEVFKSICTRLALEVRAFSQFTSLPVATVEIIPVETITLKYYN